MNFERNLNLADASAHKESTNEKYINKLSPRAKVMALLAVGSVLVGGGLGLKNQQETQNELLFSPTGTKLNVEDKCIELLPGTKIREEADGRDLTYDQVNRVYEVKDEIVLCDVENARLKRGTDRTQDFIGVPIETLADTEVPTDKIQAIYDVTETGYAWFLKSDETAQVVKPAQ